VERHRVHSGADKDIIFWKGYKFEVFATEANTDYQNRTNGKTNMKLTISVLIYINCAALSCIAQQNFQPIPPPPGKYMADEVSVSGVYHTLDGLILHAGLIIDGTVEEILPSVRSNTDNPVSLKTFSRISVNKVIKGKLPEGEKGVALAELGGNSQGYEVVIKQLPLVQSGNRYILFLYPFKQEGFVNNLGVHAYLISGQWAGKLTVTEKGTVQFLRAASPELHTYDNLDVEKFLAVLADRINYLYPTPPPDAWSRPPINPGTRLPPVGLPKR
jgi:hypothetical protein